jgi:hypothetical protein
MADADPFRKAREAAERFALTIARYRAASDALRDAMAEEAFAELASGFTETVDPASLDARQKARVRRYLGSDALATLAPDPEYSRNGFSPDFFAETIRREEGEIDESRLGAVDLAQLLAAESDRETRAQGVADALVRIRAGAELLAPGGNHQFNLDQTFAALAVQSADVEPEARRLSNEVLKRRAEQARIARQEAHPAWTALTAALAGAGLIDSPSDAADPADQPPRAAAGTPTAPEEDPIMPDQTDDASADRIVDAISRLQEGAGNAGYGGAAAPAASFGAALEQQIYASIGLPSLTSETALRAGPAKLAGKLALGLDRAILRTQEGETTRFVFHPARARALAPLDGGEVQGAQAVVAEAAANLKPAILRAVHTLKPEICTCSEDEIAEIKGDIETTLDALLRELQAPTGVFGFWAGTLVARVAREVATLIAMYGIGMPRPDSFDRLNRSLERHAQHSNPWPFEDRTADLDRDVGFLSREANEQAATTIFEHLASLADLIRDLIDRSQGATLARLRAQVEAIPPAVADARSALFRAGVSDVDLKATFVDGRRGEDGAPIVRSIELARLFDWIESAANGWRAELLEESLNIRNLRWLRDTLAVQHAALLGTRREASNAPGLAEEGFPTINPNRYALGLRQIAELARRLDDALTLVRRLYDDVANCARSRRASSHATIFAQD